jgi:hypothetical protein
MPSDFDWHKRLLDRMTVESGDRPTVLKPETVRQLAEFLAFRQGGRNVHGFELEVERVQRLVDHYGVTGRQVAIETLTDQME